MTECEQRRRHPECKHCMHGDKLFRYNLTFEVSQPAELGRLLDEQSFTDHLVETLGEYEPGWLTSDEGSDWRISTIESFGRVLYREGHKP